MSPEAKRLREEIGERLAYLRTKKAGVSQEALAAKAGLDRTFISMVERGRTAVTVEALGALCSALGVTLAAFFRPFNRPLDLRGPRRRRQS